MAKIIFCLLALVSTLSVVASSYAVPSQRELSNKVEIPRSNPIKQMYICTKHQLICTLLS
jgi:hypothetical protein